MKRRGLVVLILLLVVGFASVSTTLIFSGRFNLGFNNEFLDDIVFTRAVTSGRADISGSGKEISFETEKVVSIGQTTTLEYDVTNKSRNYDASVTIKCGLKSEFTSYLEYVTITQDLESPFTLNAGETVTGHLTVEMIKAYAVADETRIGLSCELVATPFERDTLGDEYVRPIYKEALLNGADPVLNGGLIPVTIDITGEVTYADTNSKWYDYNNKEWANAIILIDSPSKEYKEHDVILESDIESYFVWIPRYKYQIFDEGNYTTTISSKPTESIAKEIKIEFESKDVEPSVGTTKDSWLTHPAFTNFDVSGLWVGKFETGYEDATSVSSAQVNVMDPSKVIIKPNVYSWRESTVSNIFKTSYNYKRDLDSHMIKNTEWGAVAYLSHSKYGINTEVRINNNDDYLTGYAATDSTDQSSYPGVAGEEEEFTQSYNTETGYKASTTGNITGVYDMSGGTVEYVASYMVSASDESGFTPTELSEYAKYLDLYSEESSRTSYDKRILGDATGEMGPFYYYADADGSTRRHNNWYADYALFIDSGSSWFSRDGHNRHGALAGQYRFNRDTGAALNNAGSRIVLTPNLEMS